MADEELGGAVEVGTAYVSIIPSARGFAKKLRADLEAELKSLDLDKLIADRIGSKPIKLPVKPEIDPGSVPDKLPPGTKTPKLPVQLDPLTAAFRAEVQRQTDALARTVNAKIPVGADTGELRAELAATIAEVQHQLKAEIPTEPAGIREYELKLREAVDRASAHVKAKIKIDDESGSTGSDLFGALSTGLKSLTSAIPGVSGLVSSVTDLGGSLQQAAGSSAQLGGSLSGAASSAAGPIGAAVSLVLVLNTAMAASIVAAYALGPAIGLVTAALSAAAGAAAAIPAALVGAGAAIGTLSLGFKGIAAAFKPKLAGGGGGGGQDPESLARRIAAAERGVEAARRGIASASRNVQTAERGLADAERTLAAAQAKSKQAQDAVNAARKEAADDLEDLSRQLRGAQLDEADAAQAVQDATRDLNQAKLGGDLPSITRANLALERAQLNLENASDATQDLTKSQAEQAKKGVEGSDKVQSALADQAAAFDAVRQAQEGVVDAQNGILAANDGLKSSYEGLASANDALAESQKKSAAAGAAAAAKLIKLAPAAQRFVDAVKALKPAFEALRLDVQQRLFAGLDKTVTRIGERWIPALRITLGRYADTFNGFFRSLGTSITTPKFIADLQAGAEGARAGLAAIGKSITDSLAPAFGALSRAAGPFLTALGEEIAGIVTDFSTWVLQGEKTGALDRFFQRATSAMHDLFTTGKLVLQIIGGIFEIATGSGTQTAGKSGIDRLNAGLKGIADYLNDPTNQQNIRDFVAQIKDIADSATGAAGGAQRLLAEFRDIRKLLFGDDAKGEAHSFGEDIAAALVVGIVEGLGTAISLQGKLLKGIFVDAPLSLVGRIKEILGIHSPSTVMMTVGQNLILGLISGLGAGLRSLGASAANVGVTAVIGVRNGIIGQLRGLGSTAAAIRNTVIDTLASSGSWLYNIGRNIIYGLYNGIVSLGSWLYGRILAFVRATVPAPIRFALGISSPSKVTAELGRFVAQGLALGMQDGAKGVAAAAAGLADAAVPVIGPQLDTNLAAAARAGQAPPPSLELGWKPGSSGDKIMDGIRDNIYVKWRGDSVAAFSSR